MNTEWLKLRPYDGDQKKAFEELVCQLADSELIDNRVDFTRVAAPDGGKEAYCTLSNDEEYGWQAKFFTSMSEVQWRQLDESIETVLSKHPKLTRYYICTPLDREDPRINKQQWFMDKWNKRVMKWQKAARRMGRTIDFIYWGNYELFERLSRPINVGRRSFWFQETELSDDWFTHRLEESIHNLGNRYTPKVDFQLPIAKVFHGLARDTHFLARWSEEFEHLKIIVYKSIHQLHVKDEEIDELENAFKRHLDTLNRLEEINRPYYLSVIDCAKLTEQINQLLSCVNNITTRFYELNRIRKEEKVSNLHDSDSSNYYGWDIERFREAHNGLLKYRNYINSPEVRTANSPVVLLAGDAGMGKSHLLADIAQKRKEENLPTVLILGQHFTTTDEPWIQILRQIHVSCNRDIFLTTLDSYGETLGSRVLLCIDAINEGQGLHIWRQYIRGFLLEISRYPWIGLVVSVRSSYEEQLLPENTVKEARLVRVIHQGFKSFEYEATKQFFHYYGLTLPSIPLLHPEFSNPLFLHLFCKGLQKKGFRQIPDGYEGITAIISFLLDAVDKALSEKYHYPASLRITQKNS